MLKVTGRSGAYLERGSGMLEVLISMTIVAFGLLGMAGLQANSLRYQKTAHSRSIASAALVEMSERIRANSRGASEGNYDVPNDASTSAKSAPKCGTATSCSASDSAALDVFQWRQNLARNLTEGRGEISGDSHSGFIIKVYFKEPVMAADSVGGGDANCKSSGEGPDAVRCLSLVVMP